MKRNFGVVFVLMASILWASTAAVAKLLLESLDNFQVLFFSTLFATLALAIICLIQGKWMLVKTYTANDYKIFAMMGFIGIFLYRFFLQGALAVMPAQEAFIINYTWPLMVVFFAWLILKERLTMRAIVSLGLSFIGVVIVATKGVFLNLQFNITGVIFALLGAVVYGLYSVLGKHQAYDKYTSTFFFSAFALLFATFGVLAFSEFPALNVNQLIGLLWLGIFPNGLAFVFWLLALKHGNTVVVSNLIFLTPFLSLIYINVFLGERILPTSLLGLGVIVLGILLQSLPAFKKLFYKLA